MCKLVAISKFVCFVLYINGVRTSNRDFAGKGERIEMYQNEVENWLDEVDADLSKFNSLSAVLTWKLSTVPDEITSQQAMELGVARNKWKNKVCDSNVRKYWLSPVQKRKLYLLCRGPRFTEELSRSYIEVMGQLSQAYNSEICLSENETNLFYALSTEHNEISKIIYPGRCLYGEPDLERLMKRTDLNAEQLKWIWTTWHNFVGPKIKELYPSAINIQNLAAQDGGYHDIGQVWREELEIPNLEEEAMNLYEQIKPLYILLHAVVRHKLLQKYGPSVINPDGPIPAHLLGNMWAQDWSTLLRLFLPVNETIDIQQNLLKKNWTVPDMVVKAEDMYTSLGLPRMTDKFWKFSIFEEAQNTSICHGTAANMFTRNDFRMLLCAETTMEDFYIIHHEMGHIEYYMAYQNQPLVFQDGANSAFHESIGDAIMHAVMVPQHLYRLGLISDNDLRDKSLDQFLLLQQALTKIPEIPFSLIIDKYRWDIFNGKLEPDNYNKVFWELNRKFRGIVSPEFRSEEYFDAGAKFHISDNTPYIRYFLSSILQMQMFSNLCELSLYGKIRSPNNNDDMFHLPLHRCDIYGSKKAGKKLEEMMRYGSSQHWSQTLKVLSGKEYITAEPLLIYYEPIYKWLKQYVKMYNVPVGW